ncbi:VOC family protein [Flagellimonas sp. DF-77]|uniref:VOC family protein n=1 Tax=Flagellimonas algarum TaxID=3230298 RepID=UPI003392026D
MRVSVLSIPVRDQEKALKFYTEVLGFVKKMDAPISETSRWITVVPKDEQDGTQILLEPAPVHFEPSKVFQDAIFEAGIPWTQFDVENVEEEYERLTGMGVEFSVEPTVMGTVKIAVFNDTCHNYIQLVETL